MAFEGGGFMDPAEVPKAARPYNPYRIAAYAVATSLVLWGAGIAAFRYGPGALEWVHERLEENKARAARWGGGTHASTGAGFIDAPEVKTLLFDIVRT